MLTRVDLRRKFQYFLYVELKISNIINLSHNYCAAAFDFLFFITDLIVTVFKQTPEVM